MFPQTIYMAKRKTRKKILDRWRHPSSFKRKRSEWCSLSDYNSSYCSTTSSLLSTSVINEIHNCDQMANTMTVRKTVPSNDHRSRNCRPPDGIVSTLSPTDLFLNSKATPEWCCALSFKRTRRRKRIFHNHSINVMNYKFLSSLLFMVILMVINNVGHCGHYIAPGPCTWTHVLPSSSSSRDIVSSSPSSGSYHHLFKSSGKEATSNEFDVSLRCTVPVLTPYSLNLSLIDPQHTVRLDIECHPETYSQAVGPGPGSVDHNLDGLIGPQSLVSVMRRKSTLMHNGQYGGAPFEHLTSLQSLSIENCLLDRIPSDTFRGLNSLKNLTIKQTAPSKDDKTDNDQDDQDDQDNSADLVIEPHSFRHVESLLEHLDLSANQIGSLPTDFFCPFLMLHTLNLSGNHLIDLASFGLIDPATGRLCLQELSMLDLSNNRLEFVPETSGVAALKHLQHLNLSSNRITEITELAFSALRRLHVLDLSDNRLRTLPSRMFRNSDELRELHIAQNGLMELPQGLFQGLSKLQVLSIAGNQITSETLSSDTFADLIRVIVLDMTNNRLRRLSANTFQNQYSLQVLALEHNQLETIDEGAFATLYNLHTLKLSGNRFRHLPESVLTGLFVLNELSLAHNQLEHIHQDAFKNCTNLQNLDVSGNRLTTIPTALGSLNKLSELNLSGNKFTTLTDSTPLMASIIQKLRLSDNYLVNVSRSALRPIAKTLRELYLDGNRLRQLEMDTLLDLRQSLRVLRLDRNEFNDAAIQTAFTNLKQLGHLELLNISRNDLQSFDYSLVPTTLRVLDLSWNRIEMLKTAASGQTTNVNGQTSADSSGTNNQVRLEELYIHGNQLKELTAQSIPDSVRVLTVQQNRIEKIDQFAFVAKHNVTYVDMRDNHLRRIDNNAFRLGVQRPTTGHYLSGEALQDAQSYLNSHQPGTLPPPVFMISSNPYYCDCTMEWLQRVNQMVGAISGSGTISTYPRIGDLDRVQCELPFYRQANANSTTSSTTTQAVASVPRIGLLEANSSNFLCRYRSHCFALCHCCEFDACDCEMMCPENCTCYYDQTWNTNIVDCSGGHYRQVPLRIPMDVTSLYLDGNHLQSLNAHTFIGRKNLRILHLNHSQVETISNRSFNGLVYLEELHLEHNLLSALYGYEFESLHYLTILHLDHNRLSFIHERTFQSLRSLQSLRLDHNHLTTMVQWFGLEGSNTHHLHHVHHHGHHNAPLPHNKLQLTLSDNAWSCQCSSLASMYDIIWQLRQKVVLADSHLIRCSTNVGQVNSTQPMTLFIGPSANQIIDQCNLTRQYYSLLNPPPSSQSGIGQSSLSFFPASQATYAPPTPSPTQQPPSSINQHQYPPPVPPTNTGNSFESIYHRQHPPVPPTTDDENDPDLTYQPIDLLGGSGLRPKLLPPTSAGGAGFNKNHQLPGADGYGPHFSSPSINNDDLINDSNGSKRSNDRSTFSWSAWFWLLLIGTIVLIVFMATFATIRHKQDIQLWFYGRYGIRLFESSGGLFGCFGSDDGAGGSGSGSVSSSRARRRTGRHGFADTYVRDSEKLFDAFVIYARQDESFVAQQLAAELECGYPPYRLCLRYRDLPAPANLDISSQNNSSPDGLASAKDHGYAFDAVTQAIECSRRTLVVISEQFLQSEWCKFELKAAHQETLTSCKTHRLIVVVVPPLTTLTNTMGPAVSQQQTIMGTIGSTNNNSNAPSKQAELLLQRLDSETKTCIRGVTILTWQERRFWEKLRFAMPASSTIGVGSAASASASTTGVGLTASGSGVIGLSGSIAFNTINRNQHHQHSPSVTTLSLGPTHPVVCDNLKGRTSTVVVTGAGGYPPTLAPSSLSSSSSLARSSVLYDSANNNNTQISGGAIYGGSGHHYHYAQLPNNNINQSTMSLHKLTKSTNSSNQQSPAIRNALQSMVKPLPPPPNQPLPPLPLTATRQLIQGTFNHHPNEPLGPAPAPPSYVEYTNQQQQANLIHSDQQQLELTMQESLGQMEQSSLMGPLGRRQQSYLQQNVTINRLGQHRGAL